jgi:hypothetical protein
MSENQTPQELVLACDIHAIHPEQREQHYRISQQLFASVLEVREFAGGYGFRLPVESATLTQAAAFISNERLCCPFFAFTLRLEPPNAALWLDMSGREEVKDFIRAEIGKLLTDEVTQAAGFNRY